MTRHAAHYNRFGVRMVCSGFTLVLIARLCGNRRFQLVTAFGLTEEDARTVNDLCHDECLLAHGERDHAQGIFHG